MNFLLGFAAVLVPLTAFAHDLPGKPRGSEFGAPAAKRNDCAAYGAGFAKAPGTDICVRIGGFVRAQTQVGGTIKR